MKKGTKYIIAIIAVSLIGLIIYQASSGPVEPGIYDDFAKCINEKGVVMYGAYWCSHCQEQKKRFGTSFQYVNYVECDPRGDNGNPNLCDEKGVKGYPTWIFSDGTRKEQVLSMDELSTATSCTLPATS